MVRLLCLSSAPCEHSHTVSINILLQYFDALSKKYKITVRVPDNDCRLIWYIDREHTVEDLLMQLKLVYRQPSITQIVEYHQTASLLDILCNAPERQPDIRHLFVENSAIGSRQSVALHQILSGGENDLRGITGMPSVGVVVKCKLSLDATQSRSYDDIPTRSMLLAFLANNPNSCNASNSLSLQLLWQPLATLQISHRSQTWTYYQLDDGMLLYNPRTQCTDVRVSVADASQIRYLDVLQLLKRIKNVDVDLDLRQYTFESPENEFFEFDVLQAVAMDNRRPAALTTKPLCRHDIDMCAICREHIDLEAQFTRLNVCHHVYHFECIKRMLVVCNQPPSRERRVPPPPLCPLCRDSRKPIERIQVHKQYMLQTLRVDDDEFQSTPMHSHEFEHGDLDDIVSDEADDLDLNLVVDLALAMDEDDVSLDMDDDDDANVYSVNYREYRNQAPQLPQNSNAMLDEICQGGLAIMNSGRGHADDGDDDDDDDSGDDAISSPLPPSPVPSVPATPVVMLEEVRESRDARARRHNRSYSRSRDSMRSVHSRSQSQSQSDRIGRLSFSVSTSGYHHNAESSVSVQRPLLRM